MGIWLRSVSVHVLYCPKKGEVRTILLCASLFKSYIISEKLSQLKEEGFYNKDNSSAYDFALSLCGYNTKARTNGRDTKTLSTIAPESVKLDSTGDGLCVYVRW